jgi:hypothetical protein
VRSGASLDRAGARNRDWEKAMKAEKKRRKVIGPYWYCHECRVEFPIGNFKIHDHECPECGYRHCLCPNCGFQMEMGNRVSK